MIRVKVKPEMLRWAIERAGAREDKVPKLSDWLSGARLPTMKQLEDFARAVRVPIGYLFLASPPEEKLPIPDLRTPGNNGVAKPSPDLLEMVSICQSRQDWYREHAESNGQPPCDFVGSATLADPPNGVAERMQQYLEFTVGARRYEPTLDDAMRLFIERAEDAGVLVMVSGVVGTNTSRVLDRKEFQGFAIADKMAPLVFINGADWKAAQMFTLAHELAHLWLGESALSNATPDARPRHDIEIWCNSVAAEFLVPVKNLRAEIGSARPLGMLSELSRTFKVSTLVVPRRIFDAGLITESQFWSAYNTEAAAAADKEPATGGNFYLTQPVRVSKRFAKAIIVSAIEGGTLYRDAYQLLGVKKDSTFRGIGRELKVLP